MPGTGWGCAARLRGRRAGRRGRGRATLPTRDSCRPRDRRRVRISSPPMWGHGAGIDEVARKERVSRLPRTTRLRRAAARQQDQFGPASSSNRSSRMRRADANCFFSNKPPLLCQFDSVRPRERGLVGRLLDCSERRRCHQVRCIHRGQLLRRRQHGDLQLRCANVRSGARFRSADGRRYSRSAGAPSFQQAFRGIVVPAVPRHLRGFQPHFRGKRPERLFAAPAFCIAPAENYWASDSSPVSSS
jgi:hypothetical protein